MTGDIDDIIHPAENTEIAILSLHRPIPGKVRPIMPVFATRVLAVLGVVGLNVALTIAPYCLKGPWPWIPNTDISSLTRSRFNLLSLVIINDRMDTRHARTGTAGLHR